MSNYDSVFLTQGGVAASRVRKQAVQSYISEAENNGTTEVKQKTEELLVAVQGIKPQDSVIQYRQLKRHMKQAKIVAAGEIAKVQKVTFIDLEFTRKCISNEPTPCFDNIMQTLEKEEHENKALLAQLKELEGRVARIEEQVG